MDVKKMRFPEKINIVGYIYNICICRDMADIPDIEERKSFGSIDYLKRVIYIYEEASSSMLNTLIHEIVHGCCDSGGLNLKENEIERFANILTDTLLRNKLIIDNLDK
jgi:Zn-dependent peptidase ImmA (M78 family)